MSASVVPRVAVSALLCLSLLSCGAPDSASHEKTAGSGVTAGEETVDGGCVENVLCVQGDHWDPVLCRCVPDETGASDGGVDACVQRVFCILIDHWDPQLCRCVPNLDAGPETADGDGGSAGCDSDE